MEEQLTISKISSINKVNPVAKAMLQDRRSKSVVPPKKGKGSYNRAKEKVKNETAQD